MAGPAIGIRGAVTLVAILSAMPGSTAIPASRSLAAASLCTADETPIFSCPLGAKRASVCGSGQRAIYRYGRPGRIELVSRSMTLAWQGFSGGGETQIQVTNKGYDYILFDRTTRTAFGASGRNNPGSRSGLMVRRGGRILSTRECDDDPPIPSRARRFMATGGTIIAH